MKAIVYTQYGPPDVLQLGEVKKPVPNDDEVLIKVYAAEATKADCEMRKCHFALKWLWLPVRLTLGLRKPKRPVLGMYFAGEIESVGKNVSKFKNMDRVFGSSKLRLGAYGEYVCLSTSFTIVPKPDNLTFEEAAAALLGGLNALHFLRKANIQSGEKVLVVGAGGSIGIFGVQIAKAMGAEVTVVDSGHKEAMLRRIGADHFVDYTREDFTKSGTTYDVIFNMVAQTSYFACLKALKPKGRYLIANLRISDMVMSALTPAFTDKAAITSMAQETEEELLALKNMLEEGKIKSIVDKIYPMEQAAEAHRRVETEQRLGSVVISVQKS